VEHVSAEVLFGLFDGEFDEFFSAGKEMFSDLLSLVFGDGFHAACDKGFSDAHDDIGVVEGFSVGAIGVEVNGLVAAHSAVLHEEVFVDSLRE